MRGTRDFSFCDFIGVRYEKSRFAIRLQFNFKLPLAVVPLELDAAIGRRRYKGPSQDEQFQRGDVLVCRSTTVSWVPLFNMASAIVADVGGALSHAALVAREFGVPAVTGTGNALELLIDGELVEVDGSAGTVTRIPVKV